MRRNTIFILFIFVLGWNNIQAQNFKIMSWNVENLFYPSHDSIHNDAEYTPKGEKHWTWTKYNTKLDYIASTIVNAGEWQGIDVIGLMEIENDSCLIDLCKKLKRLDYQYIHYESQDERGIDVALLYRKTLKILKSEALEVNLDNDKTRDILYVSGINNKDTIHFFVCHLPSQLNGKAETEWKREKSKKVIQNKTDSICRENKKAKIIVMGDMNSEPKEDLDNLQNLMTNMPKDNGTHKYHGIWNYLDQFYISQSILFKKVYVYNPNWLLEVDEKYLGYKPKRTFNGYQYNHEGISDHLPIIIEW